jgi:hypothetical protein
VTRTDTYGISRFSRARFPAIPNPPMCRRVYDEVCTKSPELIFSALVGDDSTHNVRFERVLRT